MTANDHVADEAPTVTFEDFWDWLTMHPNCILRAGNATAVIYDDEDYHWHFAQDPEGGWLTQVRRGKRLVGELMISPDEIAFVQGSLPDREGEFLFELFGRGAEASLPIAFFVMAHGLETEGGDGRGRTIH